MGSYALYFKTTLKDAILDMYTTDLSLCLHLPQRNINTGFINTENSCGMLEDDGLYGPRLHLVAEENNLSLTMESQLLNRQFTEEIFWKCANGLLSPNLHLLHHL